jgi:hypothetical protein
MPSSFRVVLTVHPCTVLQISPTRRTLLLNILISLLYMFRASTCPPSGENYCIYATLVFVTLFGWRLVCWLDISIQPADRNIQQVDQTPPIQSDKYQCRIDTAIFLLMIGTWMPETCREEK